jgi:sarcosine oxidase subunit alpha
VPASVRAGVGVFAGLPPRGLWAAAAASGEDGAAPPLHIIRPRHVILALGSHPPTLALPGNDVPGVLSARGLVHLLARTGRRPHGPVVVIGAGATAQAHAHQLGATLVAPEAVKKIVGRRRVKAVETRDGRITARLVALAPAPAPASELAAQAGAALQWNGDGFAPVCDADGRVQLRAEDHPLAGPASFDAGTLMRGPPAPPTSAWTLWACGSLRAAGDDGAAVAAALLRDIQRPAVEAGHVGS